MKKKFRKTAALFMTLALTAGMLAGCGGDTGSGDSTSASSGSGTQSADSGDFDGTILIAGIAPLTCQLGRGRAERLQSCDPAGQ